MKSARVVFRVARGIEVRVFHGICRFEVDPIIRTTEHTEHTEARDNGRRIRFRMFGVFCGSKRQGIAAEVCRSMRLLPLPRRCFSGFSLLISELPRMV